MWQAAAPNDQALDRAGDVEGRRTEAGVDVDQQRHVAHVGDAAHVGQHVVHGVDAQVRQAQRAGGDAAARQVDGAVAGALGQQRMVGVDGADDLQRAFFGQRATEQGAGRFGSGHGWSPCMWTGCSGRPGQWVCRSEAGRRRLVAGVRPRVRKINLSPARQSFATHWRRRKRTGVFAGAQASEDAWRAACDRMARMAPAHRRPVVGPRTGPIFMLDLITSAGPSRRRALRAALSA